MINNYHQMALFLIYSSIFLINLEISHGLICYKCTTNDPKSLCVTNNGPSYECSAKFCTLYRVESDDGEVAFNLTRACTDITESRSAISNFESHESKRYYRYCSTNWCNSGDGTNSKVSSPPILVKGLDNSAINYSSVNIVLLVISSICQMFFNGKIILP